jgi:hypothetical protein
VCLLKAAPRGGSEGDEDEGYSRDYSIFSMVNNKIKEADNNPHSFVPKEYPHVDWTDQINSRRRDR